MTVPGVGYRGGFYLQEIVKCVTIYARGDNMNTSKEFIRDLFRSMLWALPSSIAFAILAAYIVSA